MASQPSPTDLGYRVGWQRVNTRAGGLCSKWAMLSAHRDFADSAQASEGFSADG